MASALARVVDDQVADLLALDEQVALEAVEEVLVEGSPGPSVGLAAVRSGAAAGVCCVVVAADGRGRRVGKLARDRVGLMRRRDPRRAAGSAPSQAALALSIAPPVASARRSAARGSVGCAAA